MFWLRLLRRRGCCIKGWMVMVSTFGQVDVVDVLQVASMFLF